MLIKRIETLINFLHRYVGTEFVITTIQDSNNILFSQNEPGLNHMFFY